jgi:hypothetical protein
MRGMAFRVIGRGLGLARDLDRVLGAGLTVVILGLTVLDAYLCIGLCTATVDTFFLGNNQCIYFILIYLI